jgi:mono-ADP-ribosyltransferase sirtuin 6
MPKKVAKRGKELYICNLQKTPLDERGVKIHARTDDLMIRVMQILQIPIPPFALRRWIKITHSAKEDLLTVEGIDVDGIPASILKKVVIENKTRDREPFSFPLSSRTSSHPFLCLLSSHLFSLSH